MLTPTKRALKPRTAGSNPVTLAFAFEAIDSPQYEVTRVAWTAQAKGLLNVLNDSLKTNHELPVRDLRLRLQVRDAGVIRVDQNLGRWGNEATLLVSNSAVAVATRAANASVADWVREVVLELGTVNQTAGQNLRTLALAGEAVEAHHQSMAVFKWDKNQHTNSVKASETIRTQYADLADFVASKLAGQEVYPGAGPMRREVSSELFANEARLLSDPIELTLPTGKVALFSLGLTVSVETYPGRPLPVVHVEHRKAVWAREPKNKYQRLSGFALPEGEARALRFEIERHGALTVQYQAIARRYDLPLLDPATGERLTATELGSIGSAGPAFEQCPVVVTHRHGQGEKNTVGRGVTDLDRQLSFEQLSTLLAPYGFFPWQTLREIPTHYKAQQDSDSGWRHSSDNDDAEAVEPDERYVAWVQKTRDDLQAHYNGQYHFVIAYHRGMQSHAVKARDILLEVLGKESLVIHLLALPEGVHGPRRLLAAGEARPPERAQQREAAWEPVVRTLRQYMGEHEHNPVRGVLVIADLWYDKLPDDSVNKQAARIVLNRELGVVVQYLLPQEKKLDGTSNPRQVENFRMRVVNAWRDMAWKSLGTMQGLARKLERSLQSRPSDAATPVILGLGIIRTNRTGQLQNDASFIPYVIELHPATGRCQASLLLQKGNAAPAATPMQDLPLAIQTLTNNGPSYLTRRGTDKNIREERKHLTQEFLYEILLERTQQHEEVIVLADSFTLGGVWPWLADERFDPANVVFNQENHAEQDLLNATFVRIRQEHAPKVVMATPQTRVKIDGQVRPAARRSDADLFRLTDAGDTLPSYYSFGSRIFKPVGGTSSYRDILNVNEKTGEEKLQAPWTDTWLTPNAVEITVAQPSNPRFEPDDLARLVESLRSEYGHYGSWTSAPGPLHFASFLKEYVPDYELENFEGASEE